VAATRGRLPEAEAVIQRERCRRSAHYFIFESGLVTKDEHDPIDPMKPFPDDLYSRSFVDCLLLSGHRIDVEQAVYARAAGHSEPWLRTLAEVGIFLAEKSRQMRCTWLICAYCLWRAKYHPHQLILVQSKKEEDAANLVFTGKEAWFARISFMEHYLPKHLRTLTFPRGASYGRLFFPNGSQIWGIPEGGDIIRSYTPSVVFSDEAGYQSEFDKAFTAAKPAVTGGGQLVAISSAEPGSFAALVEASV
jgi:hypothetical protein